MRSIFFLIEINFRFFIILLIFFFFSNSNILRNFKISSNSYIIFDFFFLPNFGYFSIINKIFVFCHKILKFFNKMSNIWIFVKCSDFVIFCKMLNFCKNVNVYKNSRFLNSLLKRNFVFFLWKNPKIFVKFCKFFKKFQIFVKF